VLSSARKAYSLYNARIEEEKREKAEELKERNRDRQFWMRN